MNKRLEQLLQDIRAQVLLAAIEYDTDEQAAFFGELADWAYAQQDAVLIDSDMEMQDFDN